MENLLFEYMNRRSSGDNKSSPAKQTLGPVITISRTTGCSGAEIAYLVSQLIEKNNAQQHWKLVSKEILQKSAEQLNLDPDFLRNVVTDNNRGMMDQIVESLSSHIHKSDAKILRTIQHVIRQFAELGNVIIIGRGGAGICTGIDKALHVRLDAPLEWRINEIATKLEFTQEYAFKYVQEHDKQRENFIAKLHGGKPEAFVYDFVVNCSHFSQPQIAEIIYQNAVTKKVF